MDVRWANFCADLVDIVDPGFMRIEAVSRETNNLDATSGKVGGTTSDLSELGGADLGKIGIGMGERSGRSKVRTGVKSAGWEKRTAHESPIQSWNLMGPFVV